MMGTLFIMPTLVSSRCSAGSGLAVPQNPRVREEHFPSRRGGGAITPREGRGTLCDPSSSCHNISVPCFSVQAFSFDLLLSDTGIQTPSQGGTGAGHTAIYFGRIKSAGPSLPTKGRVRVTCQFLASTQPRDRL